MFSLLKNIDRLAEGNKAVKTSNSLSSAYVNTIGSELCSKPKHLATRGIFPTSVKNQSFLPPSPQGEGFVGNYPFIGSVLAVGGFFVPLNTRLGETGIFYFGMVMVSTI